ncbi:MAG: WYL domain-containing protein [Bacteroidaceae bacterium]|nr:WYL domain-containing protein [Bacteroidaceae bacterium]
MKLKRRHYLILEEMMKHPEGVTRKEIVELIQRDGETGYNRKAFVKDLPLIRKRGDIDIISRDCGKNIWRYSIGRSTPDQQERAMMVGTLVANILENLFLKEFRELGDRVQPVVIPRGHEFLHVIGTALRGNRILSCTYRKFSDSEPYECTLSPYALKAYEGRWYLLARKNDEREFKHFSLDRIQRLELTEKTFQPVSFNAREFYAPFFGTFCDQKLKPQSILIRTDEQNAHYFRTLPLHHSQQELEPEGDTYRFSLHMCVTPDFEMEMRKYENTTWEVIMGS